jgi:hypothetical protein
VALPDYIGVTQGTAAVFGPTGATGVTVAMDINGLANATAFVSSVCDLGQDYADEYLVYFRVETGTTAPTAGNTADLYLISNHVDTAGTWPARLGDSGFGFNTTYTLGTSDANLRQAGPPACVLICTSDANTVMRQAPVIWRPKGRYVVALVDNNLGQPLKSEGSAADHDTRVILVPRRIEVNDT